MKLFGFIGTLCLAMSASFANAQSCTGGRDLGSMGPPDTAILSNSFSATGTYVDCYTFKVGSSASSGGITFEIPSIISSVSVVSSGGSSPPTDFGSFLSGHYFSFSSLAGGVDYTLKIVSTVATAWGGGYLGVFSTYAAPVPEPSALAMTLLGLLGLGFVLRYKPSR